MPIGIDRDGTLSPTNYLFGGGPVYVSPLTSGNIPEGAFHEFGCVTELAINQSSTTFDHFCPRNGTNVRDSQSIQTIAADFTMVVDDFKFENVELWSLGTIAPVTSPQSTVTASSLTSVNTGTLYLPNPSYTGADIEDNRAIARHYELHSDSAGLILHFGGDAVAKPGFPHSTETKIRSTQGDTFAVVSILVDSNTYLVDGTVPGLTYDDELSKLYFSGEDFLDAALVADIIAEGISAGAAAPYITIPVTVSGIIATREIDRVISLTGTSKAVMIKYEGFNTESGQRVIVTLPRVKLIPQGQMGLINTAQNGNLPFAGSLEPNLEYTEQNGGYFHIEVI